MSRLQLLTKHIRSNPEIARRSAVEALAARRRYEAPLTEACCVFDVLARAEVDVWFVPIPSLEGMYVNSVPPRVLLGAGRPSGRQRLTAAHEFGHHWFGHGTRIDELDRTVGPATPIEELEAEFFASFFLMPKSLVVSAFSRRGWNVRFPTAEQIFVVAGWLGVGYTTLITHLRFSLGMITGAQTAALLSVPTKVARSTAVGFGSLHDAWVVDEHWSGRPIDAAVGDILRVPSGTRLEGNVGVLTRGSPFSTVLLTAPGLARLENESWASYLRVSERQFVGRALFRHLPRED
jgi:hypothetical protein